MFSFQLMKKKILVEGLYFFKLKVFFGINYKNFNEKRLDIE